MYKKVYIAIDDSEFSKQALSVATKIAKIFNASLCLAHCISEDDESKKDHGVQLLEKAKASITDLTIETQLITADSTYGLNGITMAIASSAIDWEADLLVAGTSNKKGLDRFFLGSVAEELVKKVDCSVMLVRINQ
ncbi:MAG TPA: universal stress protein [Nitrosomonas sp.]|nr:universal stress protein [Nitrosomonas sp.]HQX13925.1 universal stress protein [Nitrosomonas sp.]HRB20268.1 universal stress protein [Nitrosomonas sp.]HRB33874.1 universal stress protein [Nitrosomonas sp.]HRB46759.1 universal stress protein [Nitrosomonas sp.]